MSHYAGGGRAGPDTGGSEIVLNPTSRDHTFAERPFYLRSGQDTSFAVLHPAAAGSGAAVILCPPFGWEEVSAYRMLREWAGLLATAGYPTLRLTLPSTGDSGGAARDPGRLDAWTSAIATAAAWLRSDTEVPRIVAIGMGLGATLAYRCVALGGDIDDLVLWSPASRGRAVVRQLKAFARLEGAESFTGLPVPPPLADDEIEAGGFLLSAETVRDLEQMDLAELDLPQPARRRVLLLDRDGVAVDARLVARLAEAEVAVTTATGDGYGLMTEHPQFGEPATRVFAAVADWLMETTPGMPGPKSVADPIGSESTAPRAPSAPLARLEDPDGAWFERPVTIPSPGANLAAVLTEPSRPCADGVCVVLLDAGAVRRVGPNRMWVEAARRWADRGIPTLRLDLEGIGDADGPTVAYSDDALLHEDKLLVQVRLALDYLADHAIGSRFLLIGLCSGAYWAFHTCLDDPRVPAVALVNQRVLVWDEGLGPSRYLRILFTERPSLSRFRRVVTPRLALGVLAWVLKAPLRRLQRLIRTDGDGAAAATPDELLARLLRSDKRATFLFSEREPLSNELERAGWLHRLQATGRVTVERVPVADHTLRPVWAQSQAHAALDRAVGRELAAVDGNGDVSLAARS